MQRPLALPSLLVALSLAACSDGAAPTADATVDTASDAAVDTASDAPTADAAAPCMVPPARLGTSAAAMTLRASPARCGQAPHTWLESDQLGAPGAVNATTPYAAAVLNAVATSAGINLPTPLSRDVTVDQLAYKTQDRGALLDATMLLAYPRNLASRTNFEVLLLLHGTSGFTDQCAPSASTDTRVLAAALASAGYVVAAPDYIGLRAFGGPTGFPHPYLVGQATAIASLDAVRAAMRHLAVRNGEACARPRFVTIGGSQGGHAALWVDRLAPYYAPELEHMGVVATVPPADLVAETDRALRETVPATANVAAFYATASAWYGLASRVSEVFRAPYDTTLPQMLASTCDPEVRGLTREMVYTQSILDAAAGGRSIATQTPWGCLVAENGLTSTTVPREAPTRPGYGILWVLGEQDTLVNTPIERASFMTLCGQGFRMRYLECAGASHTRATAWALPEILEFAQDRFAERPLTGDDVCRVNAPARCRATPAN